MKGGDVGEAPRWENWPKDRRISPHVHVMKLTARCISARKRARRRIRGDGPPCRIWTESLLKSLIEPWKIPLVRLLTLFCLELAISQAAGRPCAAAGAAAGLAAYVDGVFTI
jgi:hypothetical protein